MSAGSPQVGWETLPLTVATIDQLPAQCRGCTRWECGLAPVDSGVARGGPGVGGRAVGGRAVGGHGVGGRAVGALNSVRARAGRLVGRVPGGEQADPAAARQANRQAKQAWVAATTQEWGRCGQVARVDGHPVGYVLYAPPERLPGVASFPSGAPSRGVVVLATAWVDPSVRGGGIGRLLVVRAARDLLERGVTAIEAYGDRQPGPGSTCVLPADFLEATGFRVVRRHRRYPRMRMELRTAVTWRAEPARVRERLLIPVAPAPVAPAPVAPAPVAPVPTSLPAPVRRGT